ncbi:membrane-associated protein, putative [Bodo saltans]|uniref:Membrane-associated protein, putative n=1 Tax=Bodo saltans TaxID=75058 RepID=A0A0S4IJK4_BODSA|nr:membrane-associated protein, putative [Bodo saltans]|eukprot:CUE55354.1 membrane-associated protein, putative [Bodo saltans]
MAFRKTFAAAMVAATMIVSMCFVSVVDAKFEFVDVSRTIDKEKYKNIPNPPVLEQPLGACEVPNLSFARIRKELKKRMTVCDDCKTKDDFKIALRDSITSYKPVMSDEDYERYLAYELTAEGQAEIAEAAAERQAKAALAALLASEKS